MIVISDDRPRAHSPRDHHNRWFWNLGIRGVGGESEKSILGSHLAHTIGNEHDLGIRKALQHLVGSDPIQSGEPVEQWDRDLHGIS